MNIFMRGLLRINQCRWRGEVAKNSSTGDRSTLLGKPLYSDQNPAASSSVVFSERKIHRVEVRKEI
jgi:hypothetical protein